MFTQMLLVVGVPSFPAIVGITLGIIKDGAPWHRHFWEV